MKTTGIRRIAAQTSTLVLTMTMLGIASHTAIAAEGKTLYGQRLCITCHGPEGKAPIQSTYPKLAGQNKDYLLQQITDIQSGARNNGSTSVMKSLIKSVTAEEIDAIADYLSAIE